MNSTFMKQLSTILAIFVTLAIMSNDCAAQSTRKAAPQRSGSGAKAPTGSATKAPTGSATRAPAGSGTQAPAGSSTMTDQTALMDPSKATATAPDKFRVQFVTSKGNFTVEVTRAWAPNGADRFYNMVKVGYFKDVAIFRAIENFMFQFGIHGDPAVAAKWSESNIQDDPSAGISNTPGRLSFAQTGRPNSRSVQMFVNLGQNAFLDQARGGGAPFVPFGEIVAGMDVVKAINTEYGENPRGEDVQGNFKTKGNAYILKKFPNIDIIRSVSIQQ